LNVGQKKDTPMAFLVCYSTSPPEDHPSKKAIYLDQRFYELIFACRESYVVLREIASLRYKSPTLVVKQDQLDLLDQELTRFKASGISHPQIQEFRSVCAQAKRDGCALTISGDMYPELRKKEPNQAPEPTRFARGSS
jgi:hypothetical protein